MLMPLNSTMVAVALPDVADDLDVSFASTAWLVSGYLIAQASLQPLGGKLGDRLGRRPVILAGLTAFGLVSLGAALAPNLGVLIGFRVLQAVTGGLVFPNAVALVREVVPGSRRGGPEVTLPAQDTRGGSALQAGRLRLPGAAARSTFPFRPAPKWRNL